MNLLRTSRLFSASFVLMAFGALLWGAASAWAQSSTSVQIQVQNPPPTLSLVAVGDDGLDVLWDWDAVMPGFIPLTVTDVEVEISNDGINYGDLQTHAPADFQSSYTGLAGGSYTARVTIIDGEDFSYIVGPVDIVGTGGSGRRRTPPTLEEPVTVDVNLSGLSFPGPTSVVVVTKDGAFEAVIEPDNFGEFATVLSGLPEGSTVFSFSAEDLRGDLSLPIDFSADLLAPDETIDTIFIPPTLRLDQQLMLQGEPVNVSGYAYREGSVSVVMNGLSSVAGLTQADEQGFWEFQFLTDDLTAGSYTVSASAISRDGSVSSPLSDVLTFELTAPLLAAPVCGDGTTDEGEQCDDGNLLNGDGCSDVCEEEESLATACGNGVMEGDETCDDGNRDHGDGCSAVCFKEDAAPESRILPLADPILTTPDFSLDYEASSQDAEIIDVTLFYSQDGAPYHSLKPTGDQFDLSQVPQGRYEAYTIARDSLGRYELAPETPDLVFVVDLTKVFELVAKPQGREASGSPLSFSGSLKFFEAGEYEERYSFDVEAQEDGRAVVTLDEVIVPDLYDVLLKADGYLSKLIRDVTADEVEQLLLDFTFNNTLELVAGDIDPTQDDHVNGLDLSVMSEDLHQRGDAGLSDLNQDGIVNGMDWSILLSNLSAVGEGVR